MLGKLIDGRLVVAGRIVKEGNTTITNPTNEQLFKLGYKIVEYTAKPKYNDEEEKLVEEYIDGNNIVVNYTKVALTDEEHNAIIQSEIYDEEYKITQRNIRNATKGDEFALNKITEVENNIAELRAKIRVVKGE